MTDGVGKNPQGLVDTDVHGNKKPELSTSDKSLMAESSSFALTTKKGVIKKKNFNLLELPRLDTNDL